MRNAAKKGESTLREEYRSGSNPDADFPEWASKPPEQSHGKAIKVSGIAAVVALKSKI